MAHELIKKQPVSDGALVTTDWQYKGKGQRNNTWFSEPKKSFTGTYVLKPAFLTANQQFWLNKAVACAVKETISYFVSDAEVRIKWPNDIICHRKKIGGILIENMLSGNRFSWSLVGIGVNVNTESVEEVAHAISIKNITAKDTALDEFTEVLNSHLEKHYLRLKSNNFEELNTNYLHHLYGWEKEMDIELNGKQVLACKIKEVDQFGRLGIQYRGSEEIHYFFHGQIRVLYPQ